MQRVQLCPNQAKDVPFSRLVLLPLLVQPSVLSMSDYLHWAKLGYNNHFDPMWQGDTPETLVFVERCYTLKEVYHFLTDECYESVTDHGADALHVLAFCHGWLSALALTDYQLALKGSFFLRFLIAPSLGYLLQEHV